MLSVILSLLISVGNAAELVDKIVAVVNNEIITESDLSQFSSGLRKSGMIDDMLLLGKSIDSIKSDRTELLNYLISEKLLDSEVKKNNMSVTIERVEQEIRSIAKRNGATRNDLLAAIKNQGMSAAEYQNFLKTRIERQSVIEQEISSKIRVSEEDIASEYQKRNPNLNLGSHEFTLAHILFRPQKGGWEAAMSRAESVSKLVGSGQSFENLAEQHSEDPNFNTGGMLGTFKAGEFLPEIEKVISGLSANEISKPIRSKSGIHIVRVISKKVISDPKFEKEKEKIRAELFEKSFQKHLKIWIENKKEDAFVRINL
jgi:peptidyl-prolyl cis-trans isomerase SurA